MSEIQMFQCKECSGWALSVGSTKEGRCPKCKRDCSQYRGAKRNELELVVLGGPEAKENLRIGRVESVGVENGQLVAKIRLD